MKKITLLFIFGFGLLVFFIAPSRIYADCGPEQGISNIKREDLGNKINFEVTVTKPDYASKMVTRAEIECDGETVRPFEDNSMTTSRTTYIYTFLKNQPGSCILKIENILYRTDPTWGEVTDTSKTCVTPVVTNYVKEIKVDKDNNKVVVTTTRPMSGKYYVQATCFVDGHYQKGYFQPNGDGKKQLSFTSSSYKVTDCKDFTLKVNIKHGRDKAVEKMNEVFDIKPNDPCSLLKGEDKLACYQCMGGIKHPKGGIWTVFGCVKLGSSGEIFKFFFNFLSYMAGGIGALLFIYASFLYMTSGGDAEKLKKAKTLMTAIVSGILFIIFSIMIMRFIGLTLFDIPTLKKG